jgi:hypothetical protein
MENALNKEELNDVFLDVRKSYRLLYLYQRRVMDLVAFIGRYYGFSYVQGWSEFSSAREPKKLKLDNWAWDMLGMYCFTFQFSTKDFGDYKDVELLVLLVSDTGFYDNKDNVYGDEVHIEKFEDVNKSTTQLHLLLKTNNKDWKCYDSVINASSPNFEGKFDTDDFLIGKKYDLADFMNEASTLEQLKDFEDVENFKNDKNYDKFNGFAGFCRKNGIVLFPKVKS